MIRVLAWLIGSKIGRWGAVALLAVTIIGLFLMRARKAGETAYRAKQQAAQLQSLIKALRANNEITQMDTDQRRAYVRKWVSDN
ncbi:MAG: hypothetical protein JKY99_02275 [Rhizobiales bacterium]|nr:hypothetical protein [Hyphomicrobiales bacterium]